MAANFGIQPIGRFAGPSQPIKRPQVSSSSSSSIADAAVSPG